MLTAARIAPARRVDRDDRTAAQFAVLVLHRVVRGLLRRLVDRQVDAAAARVAAGQDVGEPRAEQPAVVAGQDAVLGLLDPARAVEVGVVAGDRRVQRSVRVDAQVLQLVLGRLGLRDVGAVHDDRAARARVLVEQHPPVVRVVAVLVALHDLDVVQVDEQRGEQHRERDRHLADRLVHLGASAEARSVLCGAVRAVSSSSRLDLLRGGARRRGGGRTSGGVGDAQQQGEQDPVRQQ